MLSGAAASEIGNRIAPVESISTISDTVASVRHRAHLCRVLVMRALAEASRRSAEAA
jgi:CO/xanthine dehydrogenase FAD-binding subunit